MLKKALKLVQDFLKKEHKKPPVIVILGPTASGKTALSLDLAKKFQGEIISADSRQVYKYMDIATDKLLPDQQEGIPHYLIDIIDPAETFTAGDFKKLAKKHIADIQRRGKLPFIVGGTGLYIDALIHNFTLNKSTPQLRQELLKELNQKGNAFLHQKLVALDPETAQKVHPNNTHHLIRALEIVLTTGRPKAAKKQKAAYDILKIAIKWPREVLYKRINDRVTNQFERGLIEEAKTMFQKYDRNLPSMTSLGYPQIARYLSGEMTIDQALNLLRKETRNYARRQLTWFRRDAEIHWL